MISECEELQYMYEINKILQHDSLHVDRHA